ncbi:MULTISPECIES: thiaminase II [Aneurinibacillus]|uniref:Aminopyrimidine aminohydrolase n=1 Tax=Aneurinibacillus thermoaerophilus TaxID=143495 RepID=A0A1G7XXU8_ANETH|nr:MULTISPECIES: thiaminase II [Aneurinibacillus]AMA73018.1 thiaminase II [Aneurinibacillus sp. XH2]MED0677754.1 thiaminase II [Aneurinibacillus thermoaerophilus]MED0737504.1 thiaminase II [Aneurinibacillus thermoaerophilus]MED0758075.1 thiaminase II [Aneurinibacillus thermoaerophilus]MED0761229.1 thiaminase II [Aneurinibacillus thermoaerophilus]
MSFTQQLREAADPIFEAIFQHPFVQGLANGDLKKEALIHYVKQDFEYLNAFARIYGIAISKCESREDMQMFCDQLPVVLHGEAHPHNNLCRVAGVRYEDLQGYPLAPTASHYIRHMLTVAHEGTLGEILAVLLPCPWTYLEIGQKLMREVNPDSSHPFYEWITFYGKSVEMTVTDKFRARLDEWALNASDKEKEKMKQHFLTSCQLEYAFWEMAYTEEAWPVKIGEAARR